MSEWRRLTFRVRPGREEDLLVHLHELGTLGVETPGETLHAWFAGDVDVAELARRLRGEPSLGDAVELIADEQVADGLWHERWMAGLAPFTLGAGFLVVPGPAAPADRLGRRVVRLTPGRAFGTGEHPTTRMCVALLEQVLRRGDTLLDAGTGSGILAITAGLLGAAEIVAIDTDESAVQVAAANLRLNEARGVRLIAGTLDALGRKPFDVVTANLSGATLLRLMKELAERTRRSAILSGILNEEEAGVQSAARRAGLVISRRMAEGDWVALVAGRPGRG